MTNHSIGEAFSTGLGLAIGLMMSQSIFQNMKTSQRVTRQVVVCLKCGGKNPVENRFCGQCGQALYPPAPINCPACGTPMPSNINFCRQCGFQLKERVKTRKKMG